MAKKRKPGPESEGMAEGALRELGLGNLIDFALKSPVFQERFREVNREIEGRLKGGATSGENRRSKRLSIRPHIESNFSIRHIREGKAKGWKPIKAPIRKPVERVVAENPREWNHW